MTATARRWPPDRRVRRAVVIAVAGAVTIALSACSQSIEMPTSARPAVPDASFAEHPITFVTLGGSESTGLDRPDPRRPGWAQLVFGRSLPRRTVHFNVAETGAKIDQLDSQVGRALDFGATIATVWFGATDTRAGTDPERFRQRLSASVGRLRLGGVQVILISGGTVSNYADEITAVGEAQGAKVVYLGDTGAFGDEAQQRLARVVARAIGRVR